MRVAWLADLSNTDGTGPGGAEMTQAEFRAAAPEGIEVVYVAKDRPEDAAVCDVACVFNVALYPAETVEWLKGKRVVRYWNDVAPHGSPDLTRWLLGNSLNVFCSPLHYERFPWRNGNTPEYTLIPPPVNLQPFRDAARGASERSGAVSIAPWRGWGKTPYLAAEWGRKHGGIDFYGGGQCAPPGSVQVPYEQLPTLLARYKTFVYLPDRLEPFCRTVAEAAAAGCEVWTNSLVGAGWYLDEDHPERLRLIETAAADFWRLVCAS